MFAPAMHTDHLVEGMKGLCMMLDNCMWFSEHLSPHNGGKVSTGPPGAAGEADRKGD